MILHVAIEPGHLELSAVPTLQAVLVQLSNDLFCPLLQPLPSDELGVHLQLCEVVKFKLK